MGLVLLVLDGVFVGWLAAAIEEVDEGILARMGIGALGAVLTAVLLAIFSVTAEVTKVTWASVLVTATGAGLLLGVVHLVVGYRSRGSNPT